MAGSFGYAAKHYDVSMRMAELSLLPAVREAASDTLIVADGTSCRHQIADGTRATGRRDARARDPRTRTRARGRPPRSGPSHTATALSATAPAIDSSAR